LLANIDYKFEIYFSDNVSGRGAEVSYSLGGGTAVTEEVIQNLGNLQRFEVTFNSGANTTFDWDVASTGSRHDGKVSAYVLYQAVPEPSSAALLGLGGLALILRRRK